MQNVFQDDWKENYNNSLHLSILVLIVSKILRYMN